MGFNSVISCSDVAEDVLSRFSEAVAEGMTAAPDGIHNGRICVFGVDPCSIAGSIMSDVADGYSGIPVECVRDDHVPGWLSEMDVAVILSATDGTVGVEGELEDRGCTILRVGIEGDIVASTGFALGFLSSVIQRTGAFPAEDMLREAVAGVSDSVSIIGASAKSLVEALDGNVGAYYSTSDVHACSVGFREAMASAGLLSFVGELPEFDHNELVGWSDPNTHAPELRMVVLRGESPSELVNIIIKCMAEVLEENGRDIMEVDIGSGGALDRNIRGLLIGYTVAKVVHE